MNQSIPAWPVTDKRSPWHPDNISRRDEGRAKLSAALALLADREAADIARGAVGLFEVDEQTRAQLVEECRRIDLWAAYEAGDVEAWARYGSAVAIESERGRTIGTPHERATRSAADWTSERPWLFRSAAVARCGRVAVAYARPSPEKSPVVVVGPGGCAVCTVDECGQRLCTECAPRRTRKATRRLRGAVTALERRARAARRGVLSGVEAGRHRATAEALRLFRDDVFPGAADTLDVVPSPVAEWQRRNGEAADVLDVVGDSRPVDIRRREGSRIAGALVLRETMHAVDVARRRWMRAVEQEAAAVELHHAEVQAGRARRAAAAAAAARELVQAVQEADAAVSPVWLRARDAAELPRLQAEAAAGNARSLSALRRLAEECRTRAARAYLRHVRALERGADDAAAAAAAARREARTKAARAGLFRSTDVRLVTLTMRPKQGEGVDEAMCRLRRGLVRLARSAAWRNRVAGAAWKIEAEWSTPDTRKAKAAEQRGRMAEARKAGDDDAAARWERSIARLDRTSSWSTSGCHWHVHAHVLASSGYWPQEDLRAAWQAALDKDGGGLGGVDIRQPKRGVHGVVDEVAKYLAKPTTTRDLPVALLADLVKATTGRRLLWTTGAMRGVDLFDVDEEPSTRVEGAAAAGDVVGIAGTRPVQRRALVDAAGDWSDVIYRSDDVALRQRIALLEAARVARPDLRRHSTGSDAVSMASV